MRTRIAAGVFGVLLAVPAGAQVFRWTDSQGRVHYGDRPPQQEKAKPVDTGRMDTSTTGERSGDVTVHPTEVEWFAIRGTTRDHMRASMQHTAPYSERRGSRVWGQCQWDIKWKFKHRREPGSCRIGEVRLDVTATMKLPRWVDEDQGNAQLRAQWNDFSRRLRQHEDGHKNNGIAAARDLVRRLKGLGEFPSCELLDAEIRRQGERVISEYQQLDLAFDRVDLLYLTGF
ncbi:MAG TPA: DUF922 domain-containing protein [Burkholderiales bacterium]|nr:DUF922 domain-containing protein [Burkholderiales bacterium]